MPETRLLDFWATPPFLGGVPKVPKFDVSGAPGHPPEGGTPPGRGGVPLLEGQNTRIFEVFGPPGAPLPPGRCPPGGPKKPRKFGVFGQVAA